LAERHEVIAVAHPEFRDRLNERVRFEPLDMSGWRYQPLVLARLYGILRSHSPQIVHAQANKAAAMVGILPSIAQVKRVATVHNLKRSTRMFDSFDRLIAVSRQAAAQLSHPHVEVIYNGIAPPVLPQGTGHHYLCSSLGVDAASPVVIAVGRLVPAKGFDQLVRLWQELRASLVIVGDGPERPRLEALIEELGVGDRVFLAGYRRDVPALMASADLMVIASRNEGFPYVLVEGLHVHQVIVATRVPGAVDVLPAEFMVDYGEPRQMADTIRRVLQDLEAARRAYADVWQYAARELTLECMVERTERVYREVVALP
jgi:glycosyltransferase involved in cell wall biosynthesis